MLGIQPVNLVSTPSTFVDWMKPQRRRDTGESFREETFLSSASPGACFWGQIL
jgi:hypothetical protein